MPLVQIIQKVIVGFYPKNIQPLILYFPDLVFLISFIAKTVWEPLCSGTADSTVQGVCLFQGLHLWF